MKVVRESVGFMLLLVLIWGLATHTMTTIGVCLFVSLISVCVRNYREAHREAAWDPEYTVEYTTMYVCQECKQCSKDMYSCSTCGSLHIEEELTAMCGGCGSYTPESHVAEWGTEAGTCTCNKCKPALVLTLVH